MNDECLICKAPLVYLETDEEMECAICHKKERSKKLLELSDRLYAKYANRFIGQDVTVLIEKYDEKQQAFIGHTSNYLEVKILKESKVGEYKTVKLQKSMI